MTEEGKTNVNILTTLEAERIRTLISNSGKSMQDARKQAESELFDIFHIPGGTSSFSGFDKMDITQSGEWNAVLLAISSTLQAGRTEGELSELISKIASEITSNGTIINENISEQIRKGGMAVEASSVRRNLESRYRSLGLSDYVIPSFEDYLDINGNGVVDKNDSWLILDKKDFNVSSDGAVIEIEVQYNVEFDVTIEDDAESDWVVPLTTRSYLQTQHLSFNVLPNETYDDRCTKIIVSDRASGQSEFVYVLQRQRDAIVVTYPRFEVPAEGGNIEVEVQANVSFDVEIPEEYRAWISQVQTKSLSSSFVTFRIAENFETSFRKGEIIISNGIISETIDIYQSGGKRLVLDKKDHTVSSEGGVVEIVVSSNFDYEMQMPQVDWISEIMQTKGMASGTRTFKVAPNDGYDDRCASIIFRDKNSSISEEATIWQTQKDVIIVARDSYDFDNEGGTLEIELLANVDVVFGIPEECADWIVPDVKTKGLSEFTMKFNILANDDYDSREGTIEFKNELTGISKTVRVFQGQKNAIVLSQKEFFLGPEGGSISIEVSSNVEFGFFFNEPWLFRQASTRGLMSSVLDFYVLENDTYSPRQAKIVFSDYIYGVSETVIVHQAQKDALIIGEAEYEVPYTGGIVEIEVESNIEYGVEIVEGDEWLSVGPGTKSLEKSVVSVSAAKNETYLERIGRVRIFDRQAGDETVVSITQAPNADTRTIHVEIPGTLNQIVDVETLKVIRSLKLTGTVNSDDLEMFTAGRFLTETLDLTELTVIGGVINTFGCNAGGYMITSANYSYFDRLKTVYLSPTVTKLGPRAFSRCTALETVIFGDQSQLQTIEGEVCNNSLGGYVIRGAFYNCKNLKSITFPSSIKRIMGGAFYNCENLESVTFEQGCKMTIIKGDTYRYTGGLGMPAYASVGMFCGCPSLKTFEIPASVESISDSAFKGANGLVSMVIPETVKYVSTNAMFMDCSSLESVFLPSSVNEFGYRMFEGCTSLSLKEIKTVSKIEKIGDYVFNGCTSLTEIPLNDYSSIGEGAFCGTGLTSVRIPDSMKDIPCKLFENCANLSDVDLNKVEMIGDYAFSGCSSLSSIAIPRTIKYIGNSAFSGCKSLEGFTLKGGNRITLGGYILSETKVDKLVIPSEIVSITGRNALENSSIVDIIFEDNSKCEEFGFVGNSKISSIVLPDNIKRLTNGAFYGCENLSEVILPLNLQSIGVEAFYYCPNLNEIVIPSSVDTLYERCFDSSGLERIDIPEGVKYIDHSVFQNCKELSEVSLPNTLEYIGMDVFNKCDYLKPFVINGAETLTCRGLSFDSKFISGVVFGKNIRKLVGSCYLPENYTLSFEAGARIEEIGKGFFGGAKMRSVTLPNTVKTIGESAFRDCVNLTEFKCPDSLVYIGTGAFNGCSNLTKVTLNDGLQTINSGAFTGTKISSLSIPGSIIDARIGTISNAVNLTMVPNVDDIPLNYFEINCPGTITIDRDFVELSCKEVTGIIFGNNVKTIGKVQYCSKLQSLVIPEGVTAMMDGAFQNCSALKEVILPSTLTTMGDYCFYSCKSLETIRLDGVTVLGNGAFQGCSALKEVILPSSLTTIGRSVFSNCTGLKKLYIPENVISIGDYAFSNNSAHIVWETSSIDMSIGEYVFNGCTGRLDIGGYCVPNYFIHRIKIADFSEFNILDGVKVIGKNAFMECLVSLTIPDSVVEIGDYAFWNNTFMNDIVLPSSLERIGCGAFSRAELPSELVIPDSVVEIGGSAFSDSKSLHKVIIGTGIISIGSYAFDTSELTEFYCKAVTPPEIDDNSWLFNISSEPAIYVPTASLDAYMSTAGWKRYQLQGYDF